jgi:phosphate/sulfate permease
MRKLLIIAIFSVLGAMFTQQAEAQILRTKIPTQDSCVDADTITVDVSPTSNAAVAFHLGATKVSGTVAGSATLQGSLDGTNWVDVGSAVNFTDVAYNLATFEPTKLSYVKYRIQVITSGTCKIKPIRGYWVQRGN